MNYDPPPLNSPPVSWPAVDEELRGLPVPAAPPSSACSGKPQGRHGKPSNSAAAGDAARRGGSREDLQTKDFNYNKVNTKIRRNCQIDDLDKRLREEMRASRRLRSAVALLQEKLRTAEERRRRSNGLERAFYSHLVETEALVLQRERLVRAGANETRAECLEASRKEAHERLATVLRRELEANDPGWDTGIIGVGGEKRSTSFSPRTTGTSSNGHLTHDNKSGMTGHEQYQLGSSFGTAPARAESTKLGGHGKCNSQAPAADPTQQLDNQPQQSHRHHQHHKRDDHHDAYPHHDHPLHNRDHHHHGHQTGAKASEVGCRSCWDSEGVVQAYRSVAAAAVRRLSSALFGEELQAIETAKTVAVERERMLQTKARETFESQVSLQAEKDGLESFKNDLRAEVLEAKTALQEARLEHEQQRDMVNNAERVRSSLSRRILSMQVARDQLSETVGERLRTIQAAVRQRVGFLPRVVERAVNDLVALCSVAGPSDFSIDKELLMERGRSISSGSSIASL